MSVVKIANKPILLEEQVTYLTADIAATVGSITVKNIKGFAINQVILIGELGAEGSEIIKTHSATAPTGSTVTLASNTLLPHSSGDKVYILLYDQVEFSTATTPTGSKSVLTTMTLWGDSPTSEYVDTASSTGYYFGRFFNSITSIFSAYSDPMLVAGWGKNTVGYMIQRALADIEVVLSAKLTVEDCYEWINTCLETIQGKLKRWPEHYAYNAVLGQVSRGSNIIAMPTDAYDLETNKSIIGLRIGDSANLRYLDPVLFDAQMEGVEVTQVTTQAISGQTTLEIDNSYDFADSGTVHVYISGTKYDITYTGVTRSSTAGILTGVPASGTGSISVTIPVDTYVWQNEEEGIPAFFTVRNSNIEFWPLADASEDNTNLRGDYAKVATSVDSDGDTIDFQRYGMVQDYLTWRVKMKTKNSGTLDMQDGYYMQFKEKLSDAIRTLPQNNRFPMTPRPNMMSKRGSSRPDIQKLAVSDQ